VLDLNRSITFVNDFSERLRHARTLRGLSQAALAKACGLSQSAIANYENKSRRNAKGIFKIADVLQVRAAWLGLGTGPMESVAPDSAAPQSDRVADAELPDVTSRWVFKRVSPERLLALSEGDLLLLEDVVISLLDSMERNRAG
jgi:transcriptional regulator with XRE-family HTH domain